MYAFTPCGAHGFSKQIAQENIEFLLNNYDQVDLIYSTGTIGAGSQWTHKVNDIHYAIDVGTDDAYLDVLNTKIPASNWNTAGAHWGLSIYTGLYDYFSFISSNDEKEPAVIYVSFDGLLDSRYTCPSGAPYEWKPGNKSDNTLYYPQMDYNIWDVIYRYRQEGRYFSLSKDGLGQQNRFSFIATDRNASGMNNANSTHYQMWNELIALANPDVLSAIADEDGTITITNKYEPEETAVTVTKIWDDDNDAGKVRPESIKVTLMANGESAAEQEITAEDGWTFTFDKLPVYADGKKITYTVKEKAVANYDAPVITGNAETGFKIKNPRTTPPDPYDYVFTFTKRWAGTPGDSINWKSYTLDGKEARLKGFKKTVVCKNEWRYEKWFKAMPDYYIIEDVPAGYTVRYQNVGKYADVTDRCYNGGTIINYPVPKTGDDANPILWIGCILASLTLLGGIGFIAKRRKHS